MDDQRLHELHPSAIDRTSDQYSILAGVTHCKFVQRAKTTIDFLSSVTEIEMKELDKSYHQLYHSSNNGNRQQSQQITLQTFSNILTPVLPPILIPGVFDAFDENRDG